MASTTSKKNIWKKIARITARVLFFMIVLIVLLVLSLHLPFVQRIVRQKAVAYLEHKLDTKVNIGKIYIGLPKKIILEDVYVEDRQKDTLLAAGTIKTNINLWRLIFHNDLRIEDVTLKDITARVKRNLPDTAFNYQFIVDAFVPKDTSTILVRDTTYPAPLRIGSVTIDHANLQYHDVVTGTYLDARLNHLDTRIDELDANRLRFDIPTTFVNGLVAELRQVQPLARPVPVLFDSVTTILAPVVTFKNVALENSSFNYRDEVNGIEALTTIGTLVVQPETFDLNRQFIAIENLRLDNSDIAIHLQKNTQRPIATVTSTAALQKTLLGIGWDIRFGLLNLEHNRFRFFDDNQPRAANGLDYAHLDLSQFDLEGREILINNDTASGQITHAAFHEAQGFQLDELKTYFVNTATDAALRDLYLKTPGSELRRTAAIHYQSPAALVNDIGEMDIDLDLTDSKLLVADLLTFAPQLRNAPAFAYPHTTWYIDSRINGKLSDLHIEQLQLAGLQHTRIDLAGTLQGLPDVNHLTANLNIRQAASSKQDLRLFIPPGKWPNNIEIPERFAANGTLQSRNGELVTDVQLNSSLGNANVKGTLAQVANAQQASYDLTINTNNLDAGRLLKQPAIAGPVSATMVITGKGYDPVSAEANLDGVIHSMIFRDYEYRQAKVQATLAHQQAITKFSIDDPNIDVNLDGTIDLSTAYPSFKVSGMIDSIKFQQLHLSQQSLIFRGKIDASIPVSDPNNLQGTVDLTQALLVNEGQRLNIDTARLVAGREGDDQFLRLNSNVVNANLQGRYSLPDLPLIFQNAIQPYFAIGPSSRYKTLAPYDFDLTATVADNPAIRTFVSGLERLDSVFLRSHFSDSAWNATINASAIDMKGSHLRNLQVVAGTNQDELSLRASIDQLKSGTALQLNNTALTARIVNNQVEFDLLSKDPAQRDKYHITGLLHQTAPDHYTFSLSNDGLLLNYEPWTVSPGNAWRITPGRVEANNFLLTRAGQQLSVNGVAAGGGSPLALDFTNFQLATLTGFIQTDSTFANGLINGQVLVTDIQRPLFTSNLTIDNLSLQGDTVGNVHAIVSNKNNGSYDTKIDLTGRGNDVRINGTYYPTGNNNLDLAVAVNSLPISTLQAFSQGKIRGGTGQVNGKFAVTGKISQPAINGNLAFDKAGFNFSMLNSYFSIDREMVTISETGFHFDRFQVRDSANNPLTIDGTIGTKNYLDYTFDLAIRANNFKALNSTKKDNRLFYGQLYFNTNLKVRGTSSAPVVDGQLVINDKTKMTVVLPQREPGVVAREGIVEFIDVDAPLNDSLFLAAYDSMNYSGFHGMDIAVNIVVVPEAEFNLVIDEGNGDFLNVRGNAAISAGVDPSGKINLSGSYELEQGSYELTFNLLKRKFNIEKGSRITWQGEPTDAILDVHAIYVANAAPLDLVKDQLGEATSFTRNTYLQKLPFDVHLNMEGNLMQPDISFDIVLPENKNYAVSGDIIANVRTRLDQLRIETGEMNKQVFSLLLLNRFLSENPFNTEGSGPTAGTLARQSVSKLLTEQLNNLAGDLIAGVDINFDVVSSEDYTTGARKDRTDLNVGLSKRLLNDRLTVSVGSNFELEGPQNTGQSSNILGNVALDYRISKDNRYVLRAYRKNEYQGVIEGYVIETGVGFIINLDYNRFRDIFISKAEREQRRQRRQEQRKIDEQQKTQAAAVDSVSAGQ